MPKSVKKCSNYLDIEGFSAMTFTICKNVLRLFDNFIQSLKVSNSLLYNLTSIYFIIKKLAKSNSIK